MRARRPTEEERTGVYGESIRTQQQAAQHVTQQAIEQLTPTEVTLAPPVNVAPGERSEPIRMFSMKNRATRRAAGVNDAAPPRETDREGSLSINRAPHRVQLRNLAEISGGHEAQPSLGRLAPPRDPLHPRSRRLRDNVVWTGVALALAGAISAAIWLVAGR